MKDIIEGKGPIGFWVKKADDVFNKLERTTAHNGTFNRVDWQFFNFVKEKGGASKREIIEFLSFLASEEEIQKVLDRFQRDGLVTTAERVIVVTAKGRQVFEEVYEIQENIKKEAMRDISATDYEISLATLEKMIANLKSYLPNKTETGK